MTVIPKSSQDTGGGEVREVLNANTKNHGRNLSLRAARGNYPAL
jgi:hypothetical protein